LQNRNFGAGHPSHEHAYEVITRSIKKRDENWTLGKCRLVDHRWKRARSFLLIRHKAIPHRHSDEDALHADLHHILHFMPALSVQLELESVIEWEGLGHRLRNGVDRTRRLVVA